jgi:hypothetical protein
MVPASVYAAGAPQLTDAGAPPAAALPGSLGNATVGGGTGGSGGGSGSGGGGVPQMPGQGVLDPGNPNSVMDPYTMLLYGMMNNED